LITNIENFDQGKTLDEVSNSRFLVPGSWFQVPKPKTQIPGSCSLKIMEFESLKYLYKEDH
jgi:hypothetical protein